MPGAFGGDAFGQDDVDGAFVGVGHAVLGPDALAVTADANKAR